MYYRQGERIGVYLYKIKGGEKGQKSAVENNDDVKQLNQEKEEKK